VNSVIAAAVTSGVLRSLTDGQRERAITELLDVYVQRLSAAAAEALDTSLGPGQGAA
jgi:hypothetical protein